MTDLADEQRALRLLRWRHRKIPVVAEHATILLSQSINYSDPDCDKELMAKLMWRTADELGSLVNPHPNGDRGGVA
jgi:hypothetical protein